MSTPNEMVAERITAELLKDGLVTEKATKQLMGLLATGEVKESNWSVLLREKMTADNAAKANKEEAQK